MDFKGLYYKLFSTKIVIVNRTVYVECLSHSNLIFVGKVGSGVPYGSSLSHECYTWLEVIDINKRTSLLRYKVNFSRKSLH
jgi:hypothetical protein